MINPAWAARMTAALLILLNTDAVLSALLTAGYALPAAVAAAGAVGTVTAGVIARLLPGDDTGMPPTLPWQQ